MKYFIIDSNSQQAGPFTIYELKDKGIKEDTLVWAEGMNDWTPAWQVEELKALIFTPSGTTPPPPPTPGQTAAQQNAAGQEPQGNAGQQPPQQPNYASQQQAYAGQQQAYAGQQPPYNNQQQPYAGQQDKGGKNTVLKVVLAVIAVLLIVMAVTNPSKDEHKRAIADAVTQMFEDQTKVDSNDPLESGLMALGKVFADQFTTALLNDYLNYHNYLFWSTTSIDAAGKDYRTSIGLFGHVFTISNDDLDKALSKDIKVDESSSSSTTTDPQGLDQQTDAVDTVLDNAVSKGADKIVDGVSDIVKDQVKQNTDSATGSSVDKLIDAVKDLIKN